MVIGLVMSGHIDLFVMRYSFFSLARCGCYGSSLSCGQNHSPFSSSVLAVLSLTRFIGWRGGGMFCKQDTIIISHS